MHWADVVAEKLLKDSNEHIISSGITPSGPIHLGSMREILTADAIVRAVNDKGGKAKLIYIADNADPLRKVYPFLDPRVYEKYVGMPLQKYQPLMEMGRMISIFSNHSSSLWNL